MAATKSTKEIMEITKQSFETINKALGLYNKVLDKIVPWETYAKTVKELDRFRDDYSNESATLVGEVKNLINNAQDNYFAATQDIYEWCGLTTRLLKMYLQLFANKTSKTYEAQRALLLQVLDDGVIKMSNAQAKLLQSSSNFNNVAEKLTALRSRFTDEFDSKSSFVTAKIKKIRKEAYLGAMSGIVGGPFGLIIAYSIAAGVVEGKLVPELMAKLKEVENFFNTLKATIDKTNTDINTTNTDIDTTKEQLKQEVKNIGVLKTQTEETKTTIGQDELDALKDYISDSVNALIAQCNEYQKRHGKTNF